MESCGGLRAAVVMLAHHRVVAREREGGAEQNDRRRPDTNSAFREPRDLCYTTPHWDGVQTG